MLPVRSLVRGASSSRGAELGSDNTARRHLNRGTCMMLSDTAPPPSQPSLTLLSNAPPQPPNGPGLLPTFESGPLFLVGVGLAVGGNTLIACSLTLQKFCVNREVATGVKTGSMPLFWLALAGMIGGEVGNFAAFGFCSQTVVSPLGAVSVIVNTVLAAVFLGEKIYGQTIIGIALTLVGSVGVRVLVC